MAGRVVQRSGVFVALAILLQVLFAGMAVAQEQRTDIELPQAVAKAEEQLSSAERKIRTMEKSIEANAEDDARLVELQLALDELARELIPTGVSLRPRLTEVKSRLDLLGEAPAAGEPAEPPAAAAERERLTQERALINALTGRAEALSIKANELGNQVTEMRRTLFTHTLFRRTVIDGAFFRTAGEALVAEVESFQRIFGSWLRFVWSFKFHSLMASLFFSSLVALAIFIGGKRIFGRVINRQPLAESPIYLRRLSVAFWSALLPFVSLAMLFISILALMTNFAVLRGDISTILSAICIAILIITFVAMVARSILSPHAACWRLIAFSDLGARRLYSLIVLMAVVNATDFALGSISQALGSPVVLTVAKSLFATVIVGLILVGASMLKPVMASSGDPADPGRPWPAVVRFILILGGAGMVLMSLVGFVGLSRFVSEQILLTGAILAMMFIGFQSGHAVMEQGNFAPTGIGGWVGRRFSPSAVTMDQIGLGLGLAIYFMVLLIGIPLILLQWGFRVADIERWLYRVFTDIRIGGISISLSGILVGVLLFLLAIFGTRRFQRWIDGSVMSRSHMDPGVRNSIRTAIGYLGVAIAGLIGVLAAGIDLSSLALIAGALSLGIGFGLQNIVSNFVSGLILLAERPFKVGDWVQTGATQGFVKRISVRATEIETFERQSIIVPNSELINAQVGNWNHRNSVGRADITVGVSYDADPARVLEILGEIAESHELVLRNPPPVVHFVDFGASSLDFEVKVFLADVLTGMSVKNDLRVAIYHRLKAEGIEIPFPQSDVNFAFKKGAGEAAFRLAPPGHGEGEPQAAKDSRRKRRQPARRFEPDDAEDAAGEEQ